MFVNPFGIEKPAAATLASSPASPATPIPPPDQAANDNAGSSNSPAANPASPRKGDSNSAAILPVSGPSTQAATAIPAGAANAIANALGSSTNTQGSVVVATSQAPRVISTSTNAQGSQVVTTIPVISQQLLGSGASTAPVVLQTPGIHPVLVIGSSTSTLFLPTSAPTITLGTQAITANAQGQYIVGSLTLTPGGGIVVGGTTAPGGTLAVGGTTISLAPSATQAVVGTSTEALAPYIVGGLGSGPNGTGAVRFLGGAVGRIGCWELRYLLVMMMVGILGIFWVL